MVTDHRRSIRPYNRVLHIQGFFHDGGSFLCDSLWLALSISSEFYREGWLHQYAAHLDIGAYPRSKMSLFALSKRGNTWLVGFWRWFGTSHFYGKMLWMSVLISALNHSKIVVFGAWTWWWLVGSTGSHPWSQVSKTEQCQETAFIIIYTPPTVIQPS